MTVLCLLLCLFSTEGFSVLPIPLEPPEFPETGTVAPGENLLRLLETVPSRGFDNWFRDVTEWPAEQFHRGGAYVPVPGVRPPEGVPVVLDIPGEDLHLDRVIHSGGFLLATYGLPPNRFGVVLNPSVLVVHSPGCETPVALDFLGYSSSPGDVPGENEFTFQRIRWAEMRQGVLYVENAHGTYSSCSSGQNGYITALDPVTLEVLWRSGPLTANAENFVFFGERLVCGYGFTGEEDYLYVLDCRTGGVVQRVPLPSAPEYLFLKDGVLRVKCADTDLTFRLVT
jgi:hypothetical protein